MQKPLGLAATQPALSVEVMSEKATGFDWRFRSKVERWALGRFAGLSRISGIGAG